MVRLERNWARLCYIARASWYAFNMPWQCEGMVLGLTNVNQTFQGNVLFSNELARRYGDQGIVSTSLNPGNLRSDLQRHLGRVHEFILVSR